MSARQRVFKSYPSNDPDDPTKYVIVGSNLWSIVRVYENKADALNRAKFLRTWTGGLSLNLNKKRTPTHVHTVLTDKGWAVVQQSPHKQYQIPKDWLVNGKVVKFKF